MIIYKVTNTLNGKIYIGQTTRPLYISKAIKGVRECAGRFHWRFASQEEIQLYRKEASN